MEMEAKREKAKAFLKTKADKIKEQKARMSPEQKETIKERMAKRKQESETRYQQKVKESVDHKARAKNLTSEEREKNKARRDALIANRLNQRGQKPGTITETASM